MKTEAITETMPVNSIGMIAHSPKFKIWERKQMSQRT
jgi:hypothetical protein